MTEHWKVPPLADTRTWLPLDQRGLVASGHRGRPETCARCLDATGARSPEVSSKETSLPSLAAVERATLHTQTRRGRSVRSDATLVPDTVDTAQAFADATVRQKILLVAATLGEWFRVGDLVVACWRLWPKSFGLSGYLTQYPDASKVTAKLSGPTGLVGLGWLDRLDTHVYAVTTLGRSKARYLMATVTRAA